MKATLKNYRQSPRKVRLVADFVRGKEVKRALSEIGFLDKRAAGPLKKLIESAVANAKENFGVEKEDLVIKDIQVGKGVTLKRYMPRAFGRASSLHKHASHISLTLSKKQDETNKTETSKEATKMKKASAPETKKSRTKPRETAEKEQNAAPVKKETARSKKPAAKTAAKRGEAAKK